MYKLILVFIVCTVYVKACYWNSQCPYQYYGSKTPYDTVRGDIRDFPTSENCEAVSLWTIIRHGNRHPSGKVTAKMQKIISLRDEIVASYDSGNSQLCTQDIENLRTWQWNSSLDDTQAFLTSTGYQELYGIGKRIKEKYPNLLVGNSEDFYFRPTNEERTVSSCMAYVNGLTDGVDLNVTVESPWKKDFVIWPYKSCDRYLDEVRNGAYLKKQLEIYINTPNFVNLVNNIQDRLGIQTNLTSEQISSMYELCRFYRSWSEKKQDPWCAVFTPQDLLVMEYFDDIRHYYRNGHGSQVNKDLGKMPLGDLYENFEASVFGGGRRMVSYFSHDTMLEMIYSALELYNDEAPLDVMDIKPGRKWRTSFIGAFSTNLIAVLNRCKEDNLDNYYVQIFVNEKETPICPVKGCTWQEFQEKFQDYSKANLSFCAMDYVYDKPLSNIVGTSEWLSQRFQRQK